MTRAETIGLIELIRRAFPRFIEPSPWEPDIKKAVAGTVDLWAEMFVADPLPLVTAAAKHYIAASKFPPAVADIRAIVAEMLAPAVTPADIWQEAHILLNAGIPANKPEKAYARMTPACKAAVLSVGGWYTLSMSDEGDVHIRRSFVQAAERFLSAERQRAITGAALSSHQDVKRIGGTGHG